MPMAAGQCCGQQHRYLCQPPELCAVPIGDLLSPRVKGLLHTLTCALRNRSARRRHFLLLRSRGWSTSGITSGADTDDYERLVAATLCFMVYACAGRCDLARAFHIEFDLTPT